MPATNELSVSHKGHRQRMKNRLLKNGLENFQDHEVLEMLLYYSLPYKDTNALGHRLLDHFGSFARVLDADYADLLKVPGITPHVATLITLCGQTAHRYMRCAYDVGQLLYNTEAYAAVALPYFIGKKNESVLLISLDNKFKKLNVTRIFEGSVNSAQFNFRLAVQQALQDNATQVVLAHNHPNGLAFPSGDDLRTTRRFAEVLKLMDIRLIDHLIVAEDDCLSMADSAPYAPYLDPDVEIPYSKSTNNLCNK
ncbi:MAG: DNA repair protein RadC [Ruminococcaceae bacterium]|nr:DNA repair protein RadC [Oscillospiraceae bacterium]